MVYVFVYVHICQSFINNAKIWNGKDKYVARKLILSELSIALNRIHCTRYISHGQVRRERPDKIA